MSTILVTGATGQLGKAVVEQLLQKTDPHSISVLVRDPQKAQELQAKGVTVIQGDYTDYASLITAFKGVDKLYFVSSSELINRLDQHQNVLQAAVEAGVNHLFYTSAQRKSEDGTAPHAGVADVHWQTDNLLKESGLTYSILKHSLYTDILPMFIGPNVLETGTIFLPAGDGKVSFATRRDMAVAAAILLTGEGHANKVYDLAGSRAYSFGDIAHILSELSGKTIQYISPSTEEFAQQLASYGLPPETIQGFSTFCEAIAQDEFDFPSPDLETILERKPESVQAFLKAAYQL